jgi:hypothetical protein
MKRIKNVVVESYLHNKSDEISLVNDTIKITRKAVAVFLYVCAFVCLYVLVVGEDPLTYFDHQPVDFFFFVSRPLAVCCPSLR